MSEEPPALLEVLENLIGFGANVVTQTFRRIEVAEEEIVAAKERHPDKATAIHKSFRALCPPECLRNLADEVYRAHCRELLERVANGEDLRPGTAAEVVAAIATTSHVGPLTRSATLLYMGLFEKIFPGKSEDIFEKTGRMEPDPYEAIRMRELEAELRRKLATDRGVAERGERVRETAEPYSVDVAAEPPSSRRGDIVAVREVALRYIGRALRAERLLGPADATRFARKCVKDDSKEHFIALYLDGRHAPIGHAVVSVGTATASLVHPREVFQPAVHLGAVALLVLHNHPSGDPSPSSEDRDITKRLCDAGRLLGIHVLDHVVWTRDGRFRSLREEGSVRFDS